MAGEVAVVQLEALGAVGEQQVVVPFEGLEQLVVSHRTASHPSAAENNLLRYLKVVSSNHYANKYNIM